MSMPVTPHSTPHRLVPGALIDPRVDPRARIERALARFLRDKASLFADPLSLHQVFELTRQFVLNGGKRMRPLLCYWGWRSAGGDPVDPAIFTAAASLEIFHSFALIHDDIMDASDTRRGHLTLHQAMAAMHTRQHWNGEPHRFGTSMAILSGDVYLAWSDELLHTSGLPADRIHAALPLLHQMRTEVVIGQYLDLLGQGTGGTLDSALKIISLKAAKYTIERPLQIGAVLAGATPTLLESFSAFGVPLGEAFQLRDDILGVFGDPSQTGKSNMDDLRGGKPTALIAIAREAATPIEAACINDLHGNPHLDHDGAARLRAIIRDTGALATVEDMIASRAHTAHAALARALLPKEAHHALAELLTHATQRDT